MMVCRPVDGFTAAGSEDAVGQIAGQQLRQLLGQQGTVFTDQVMVADIAGKKAFLQRRDHVGMAMAQVEYTPIAVAVDQALVAGDIPYKRPFPAPEYEVDADIFKKIGFSRGDVTAEAVDDC